MSTRCWPNLNGLIWKLVHSVNGVTFLTFLFEIAVLAFLAAQFWMFLGWLPCDVFSLDAQNLFCIIALHFSSSVLFPSKAAVTVLGLFGFGNWYLTIPCALSKILAKVHRQNEIWQTALDHYKFGFVRRHHMDKSLAIRWHGVQFF